MVLGLIGVKLVTTALSQELVGNYQTVYSYLQIFGILADFGLYAVAVRELAKAKDRASVLGSLFALRACITVFSLGMAITLAWIIPTFRGTPLPLGISIAVFVPFFTLLAGMFRTLFQVEYKMQYVFVAELTGKVIPVCLIAGSVFLGARQSDSLGLYHFFLASGGAGSLVLLVLSFWFARRLLTVRPRFSRSDFQRIARLASPFGLAFLMTTMYRQSDLTLIALLRPEDYGIQNAYYGTVLRLVEVGFLLPTLVLNSALPAVTILEKQGKDTSVLLGQVLLGLLTIGSIVSLFAFFWAKPLVLLLTRESYLSTPLSPGSDTALQLLSFSMFLSVIVTFCFYLLLTKHWWRRLLWATSAAAFLSVVLNLKMIPLFGFIGAGVTSILVHLLLAITLVSISLPYIKVSLRFDQFARWFAFSLTLALLLWLSVRFLQSPLITLLGGIIGIGMCILLLSVLELFPIKKLLKKA